MSDMALDEFPVAGTARISSKDIIGGKTEEILDKISVTHFKVEVQHGTMGKLGEFQTIQHSEA